MTTFCCCRWYFRSLNIYRCNDFTLIQSFEHGTWARIWFFYKSCERRKTWQDNSLVTLDHDGDDDDVNVLTSDPGVIICLPGHWRRCSRPSWTGTWRVLWRVSSSRLILQIFSHKSHMWRVSLLQKVENNEHFVTSVMYYWENAK